MATFDELVTEADAAPIRGWDFSWLDDRSRTAPLPWSYRYTVADRVSVSRVMLDMGTGGGEWLSGLKSRPPLTVATEAWPPNVGIAATRLGTLGIPVVQVEAASDNTYNQGDQGRLPFRDATIDLVVNRHEAFPAREVSRILAPGGHFVTQQVDWHNDDDFYRLLGLDTPNQPDSWLSVARHQLERAGLVIEEARAAEERRAFYDVAAVIYYLRIIDWAVPEFSVQAFEDRLRAVQETPDAWPFVARGPRFMLVATKPA
ncbi:MAG: class I SAM-dependent methyltransferase [Acidimicrobiales bacterium]